MWRNEEKRGVEMKKDKLKGAQIRGGKRNCVLEMEKPPLY